MAKAFTPVLWAAGLLGFLLIEGCGRTIEEEAEMGLENLRIILEEAGSSLDKTLKVTVYLLDIEEYGRFNDVYRQYFKEARPARVCIQAGKLPFNTRVEIDAIAYI